MEGGVGSNYLYRDDGGCGINQTAASAWDGRDGDRRRDGWWCFLGAGLVLRGANLRLYCAGLGLSRGQQSIRER